MANFPHLLTLEQFADRHEAFPVSRLRWLKFRSTPVTRTRRGQGGESTVEELLANGFAAAFLTVGGRVMVDESRFFEIIAEQNHRGVA